MCDSAESAEGQPVSENDADRLACDEAVGRLRDLERITALSQTKGSLRDTLRVLVEETSRVFRTDLAAILLLDGDDLVVRATSGLAAKVDEGVRIPASQGLAGRIVAARRPLVVADPREAEVFSPLLEGTGVRSLVGVLLQQYGRVMGVMYVGTLATGPFAEDDLRLLRLVADRIGAVVERAELREAAQRVQAEAEQTEAFLKQSEGRLAAIVGSAMDAIISVDEAQRIVVFNAAAERIFGYTADEMRGQPLDRLMPARFQEQHRMHVRHFGNTGQTTRSMGHPGDLVGRRRNGEEFPIEATISQVAVRGSKLFTVILRDVTDRKRDEQALRRNEAKLRTVLATLPVGVTILDACGTIVECNEAMTALWGGVQFVGIDGFGVYKGCRPDTGEPLKPEDWPAVRAVQKGETVIGEVIDIEDFAGRRKTMLASATPLWNGQDEIVGAVAVSQDVTPLRRAEAEARQAAQGREELLSIVSHDLKTPLSAILLNAQLLAKVLPGDEAGEMARQRVEHIVRSAGNMNRLIADLLDLSRIRAGKITIAPQREAVGPLIGETCDALREVAAAKSQQLVCDVTDGITPVLADRARVLQVLANLAGNAVKFTPERGHITVFAKRNGGEVVFGVRDDGPGIASDQMQFLFQRFWQAKETAYQGTGLGLAIAKGIVEAHGGRIWAESTVGAGSTFYFTLAAAGPSQEVTAA
jgi:PAS domain S-box-containing protein